MDPEIKTYLILLIISLILIIGGGAFASYVNSDFGFVHVYQIAIYGDHGAVISAMLYLPSTASTKHPAPAILAVNGWNNQKEFMQNVAIELARRGYVVLIMDPYGHGLSGGSIGLAIAYGPYGTVSALKYLTSLPMVNASDIGLVGHSMGGLAITEAALALPNDYRSMFFMESTPFWYGFYSSALVSHLKNVAIAFGLYEELGPLMMHEPTGFDAPKSPLLMQFFNTSQPVVPNEVYGSINDGTARILYQPPITHAQATDDPTEIAEVIQWFYQTLGAPIYISPTNQIWQWKVVSTGLALFGAFIFLFATGALLLRTSVFRSLVRPIPDYKGFTGIGWWINAVIATALGPALYIWTNMFVWSHLTSFVSVVFPQVQSDVYMFWALVVGGITIVLLIMDHLVFLRKKGASAINYGLSWGDRKTTIINIIKAFVFAVIVLSTLYVILDFVFYTFNVDFRLWIWALESMTFRRFIYFWAYLLPFAILLVPLTVLFSGFMRPKAGKISTGAEMAINSVVLTLGIIIWLIIVYGEIFTDHAPNLSVLPIYMIPFVILWPLVASLITFYFRKTGNAYVGMFLVTMFIVWYVVAFDSF